MTPRAALSRADSGHATAAVRVPFPELVVPARFAAELAVTAFAEARALALRLVVAIGRSSRRRKALRHMMDLDDHLLRDLGIRREEIPDVVRGLRTPGW